MILKFAFSILLVAGITCSASAQHRFDLPSSIGSDPARQVSGPAYNAWFTGPGAYQPSTVYSPYSWQEQADGQIQANGQQQSNGQMQGDGQQQALLQQQALDLSHHFAEPFAARHPDHPDHAPAAGGAGGGGGDADAGAGAANNPGVPLAQFQFQNVFIPESYEGTGYSNQFIVQPVIPIMLKPGKYFEYHIVRPTLPILAPVPDPDGSVGDTAGVGDLTVLDAYFHTIEKGLIWGIGPAYILPSSTNRQTGLGEWQLGPAVIVIDSRKKGWVTGALVQAPFSLESDVYSVTMQPIFTKLLKDDWYVGWGDQLLTLSDQNDGYNIPINIKVGRVVKAGKQPINIFVQPQYTPDGFHSGPTAEWGIKLSMSFLLPGAEFGYSKEKAEKRACRRGCHEVCYCQ